MVAPVIGLTMSRTTSQQGLPMMSITDAYVAAILEAGGIPVMIPLGISEEQVADITNRLDGVLFTGGGDVHPFKYGGQEHPLVNSVDEDRDRVEIELFQEIVQDQLPFLGICRGLQVINVACGGSLYEDIVDQRPGSFRHSYYPDWPRDYLAHNVKISEESRLAQIVGQTELQVNSLHHQGINLAASGLKVTAHAPDGVIEAVEMPAYPFGLAVQWHPEWLRDQEQMRAIFRAFIDAARPNK